MVLDSYFGVLAWGLLLLASWVGWGRLVERFTGPAEAPRDWGLLAGWGMALTVFLGGLLNLFHLSRTPVVAALVLGGLGYGLYARGSGRPSALPLDRRARLWLPLLLALPLLQYGASVGGYAHFNACDDFQAYLAFPQRMLQTGTFLDPFSLRRLATYGGHAFLQAQVLVVGQSGDVHLLEAGLCPLILAGLLLGHLRPSKPKEQASALLLIVALLLLPTPRINAMSAMTGVVLLLTLFRTLASREAAMPTALVAAAVCTLRANFWPAALGAVLLAALGRALEERGSLRRHTLRALGTLGLALLGLLPWMLLMYLSSKSLVYPFMRGTHRPDYELYSRGLSIPKTLAWVGGYFFGWEPTLALLPLPLLLLARDRARLRAALPFGLAALATALLTAAKFNFTPYRELWRYTFPLLLPMFVAALLPLMDAGARAWERAAAGLCAGALLLFNLGSALDGLELDLRRLARHQPTRWNPDLVDYYRRLQAAVPPGAPLFSVLDHPVLLDLRRNPVHGVDVIGACSLPPGMPFFQGPGALKAYLKAQGLNHVAVVDFERSICLYNRRTWIGHLHGDDQPVYAFEAKYFLDFMDNLEALEGSEKVLFSEGPAKVLELR